MPEPRGGVAKSLFEPICSCEFPHNFLWRPHFAKPHFRVSMRRSSSNFLKRRLIMRTKSNALLLCALTGGTVLLSAARADEYHGTMEQQMACTPDVWRFCSDQIPDANRIVA